VVDNRDLEEEQRFLDRAYRGLENMREDASRMLRSVLDLGRGGTFQSRTERDIVVRTSLARLAHLDIGDQALLFGRIDRVPEDGQASGDSFHIGRVAVSGEDLEPLVVDWRAPVAEPFYRATGLDPQGLTLRRHLAVKGSTVTGVEDEYFVVGGSTNGSSHGASAGGGEALEDGIVLGGPGALLAALGQARTGHMTDIVATIQREQDEIIRSPLAGVLLVQGGPGTGKTAVALHRAAYLLYTHRFPLERQGVLVVGPNPLFLRYIEQVLPSLGETGVTLSTVSGLVPEVKVVATEAADVALLKGEARMAKVLTRAVRTRERALRDDLVVPFGPAVLRLRASESSDIINLARRRPGTHNARRRFVEQQLALRLTEQYRSRATSNPVLVNGSDTEVFLEEQAVAESEEELGNLRRQLLKVPEVLHALDRMWPKLAPHEFIHDLLGARPLLRAAGEGLLSQEEQNLLYRPRSNSLSEVAWTPADAALIDEARALLGPRRSRTQRSRVDNRDATQLAREEVGYWPSGLDVSPVPSNGRAGSELDEIRSYGHIVVDEVQDLSPLQLRMLARRSLSGSMTVVGDIAQATGPWAPRDWAEVMTHLTPRREPRLTELTVSYRTPAEVLAIASRVLKRAAPAITAPRPVRHSGVEPVIARTARASLAERVAEVVESELALSAPGRTAILAPEVLLGEIAPALLERGLDAVDPRDPGRQGLSAPLVLLPTHQANGLEFDSVIVVEPGLIAAEARTAQGEQPLTTTTRGLRTLYVALTRPTRRLAVVHSEPLPEELRDAFVDTVSQGSPSS
jgi:DNA helicase IV